MDLLILAWAEFLAQLDGSEIMYQEFFVSREIRVSHIKRSGCYSINCKLIFDSEHFHDLFFDAQVFPTKHYRNEVLTKVILGLFSEACLVRFHHFHDQSPYYEISFCLSFFQKFAQFQSKDFTEIIRNFFSFDLRVVNGELREFEKDK